MNYNLLDSHKKLAKWLVEEYRGGTLAAEFTVSFFFQGPIIYQKEGKMVIDPRVIGIITGTGLEALAAENLIILRISEEVHDGWGLRSKPTVRYYICGLLQKIFTAVDTNFGELERTLEPRLENIGGLGLDISLFAQILAREFTLNELDDLLFNMGIGNEVIPGDTIQNKTREAVQYAQRHGRLLELLIRAAKLRPRNDWSSLYQ